ncbi:MAG: 16S rRNA (cytosine(1402)-N(4))-methyltransferase RsmH [Ignavibacteria bacterium]|nr:16S rRNA (cytosine(1402)-N(4))-methyltransferase RsmH [Ignavibacteria bacterium]MBT8382513.1 16S rRNA (cytosine(1402)-N(4))-methyltransferase RsmH [Ignavibacteria bacterium]NNL19880.1 16S rRNA (cytosine(1402)-N(4))-methyltransferase RsmH [Ignavibacteriaceae bacterium]
MKQPHSPVLLNESIKLLVNNKAGKYFEATMGFGGHTEGILEKLNSDGIVVSTDVDINAFSFCKEKFKNDKRVKIYKFNFSLVDVIAKIDSIEFFDGILADLGVSSFQLDDSAAGFSYSSNTDLDLRLDKNLRKTAADILNEESESALANIIYEFGEEKNSRRIAKAICKMREIKKITKTEDLKEIISSVTNARYLVKTLSRVFQALRIYVNEELNILRTFLENSMDVLGKGGRLVIISYHSLEDRIVKEFFKHESLSCICPKESPVCTCGKERRLKILTSKPITPTANELQMNKRARSAKLRAAERI